MKSTSTHREAPAALALRPSCLTTRSPNRTPSRTRKASLRRSPCIMPTVRPFRIPYRSSPILFEPRSHREGDALRPILNHIVHTVLVCPYRITDLFSIQRIAPGFPCPSSCARPPSPAPPRQGVSARKGAFSRSACSHGRLTLPQRGVLHPCLRPPAGARLCSPRSAHCQLDIGLLSNHHRYPWTLQRPLRFQSGRICPWNHSLRLQ